MFCDKDGQTGYYDKESIERLKEEHNYLQDCILKDSVRYVILRNTLPKF
ncbi:hypothetical protein CLLU_12140 [Clostridium luticellarii]|uniref:Uncharacterized protein n=1 Tax=Clostridium luticellarii TaxID=1691940 RepID=A0A2T0BPG4_9CLOT|nr:hypothetical protein CLLU_12140 [Clostridium luticellarii]